MEILDGTADTACGRDASRRVFHGHKMAMSRSMCQTTRTRSHLFHFGDLTSYYVIAIDTQRRISDTAAPRDARDESGTLRLIQRILDKTLLRAL